MAHDTTTNNQATTNQVRDPVDTPGIAYSCFLLFLNAIGSIQAQLLCRDASTTNDADVMPKHPATNNPQIPRKLFPYNDNDQALMIQKTQELTDAYLKIRHLGLYFFVNP